MAQNDLHATLSDTEMESDQPNVSMFSQILPGKSIEKENIAFETQLDIAQREITRSNEEWKTVTSQLEVTVQKLSKATFMTDRAYGELESKICSLQFDLSKAREENIRLTRKTEFGSNEYMIAEVAQPECLKNEHQTEIKSLKATNDDLELRLKDVQLSNCNMAAELENLKKTKEIKNQNLLATVQESEDSRTALIKQNAFISDELAKSQFEKEGLKAKITNLQSEVEDLEENEKILNKNLKSAIAIEAKLESLETKNKNLSATVEESENSKTSLIKQITLISDKLSKSEFEKEGLKAKITNLQSEVEDLEENEKTLNKTLKSAIAIEAKLESLETKNKNLSANVEKYEDSRTYLIKQNAFMYDKLTKSEFEKEGLKAKITNLQSEAEQAIKEFQQKEIFRNVQNESMIADVAELKYLTTVNPPEDPATEVQTRTLWFRRATSVLKVGLSVGVGIVGTLLVTGITHILNDNMTVAYVSCDI